MLSQHDEAAPAPPADQERLMENHAGFMQMGSMPAAAGARAACGQPASYLPWLADAKSILTFVDVPTAHRHRRPWGSS